MSNNTFTKSLPDYILCPSVVFKFIAMLIGILGNAAVLIYTLFSDKEKTATSYLVANLAMADLLVCLTFYPTWITEFIRTILNIDSDQDLFCKLSRSTIWALLFVSVATLLAITIDRFLFIVKPLKYQLIVIKRRVFQVIFGIWVVSCSLFILYIVNFSKSVNRLRSFCDLPIHFTLFTEIVVGIIPLLFIFFLNFYILNIARKQRKRIIKVAPSSLQSSPNIMNNRNQLCQALKSSKTFLIVVVVLMFCCFIPTVVGSFVDFGICDEFCQQIWYVVFQYEFFGVNSIVNPFIYGMRHVKCRRAYGHTILRILHCH